MIGHKKGDDEADHVSIESNTEFNSNPSSSHNAGQDGHMFTVEDGLNNEIDETQFQDVILEESPSVQNNGGLPRDTCKENDETCIDVRSEKRCKSCRSACQSFWKPIRTKYNPLSNKPSKWQQLKFALFCPPHGNAAELFAAVVSFLVFWGVLIAITEKDAVPGGNIFALVVLFVCCVIGGHVVTVIRLPPLLGMLIAGFMLRNVPKINVGQDIDNNWSRVLRNIALTVILLRAGLGLDPKALKKLSCVVIRLAFLPCLAECVAAAIASHLLLGFPWEWGFMLGFVLAAVSPAVVVPSLLSLQERGYGINKGIPTLVIAAASVDDVLAITGFGVVLSITFSTGDLVWTLFKGPVEALLGILYGVILGVIAWYLPHKDHKDFNLFRFVILFMGGMLATFGSQAVDLPGAGPLGCLTLAFIAAYRWRSEQDTLGIGPTSDYMALMWAVFQPLLFGLIGAEVDISQVQASTIGLGIAVLCIGLFIRVIVSFLAVFKAGLTIREMIFIPFAWLPKATVQAAIGSYALDTVRTERANDAHMLEFGRQVLTIAVLVILITAPVGAALISLTGPRLLSKTDQEGETASQGPETTALTTECPEKKD